MKGPPFGGPFFLFERNLSMIKIHKDGTKEHYNSKGQLHRTDGPAIEWMNGYKAWLQNGKFHRINGPAIEWPDGTKFWYQNGKLHCLDGPAAEYSYGEVNYWIEGVQLTEKEFNERK